MASDFTKRYLAAKHKALMGAAFVAPLPDEDNTEVKGSTGSKVNTAGEREVAASGTDKTVKSAKDYTKGYSDAKALATNLILSPVERVKRDIAGIERTTSRNATVEANREYQRLMALDVDASKRELDELNKQLETAKWEKTSANLELTSAGPYGPVDDTLRRSERLNAATKAYNELSKRVTELNRDIKNATLYQDNAKYRSYLGEQDFAKYTGTDYPDEAEYMTGEEKGIYNYVLHKYGEESAKEYMEHLQEAINYRKGTERGEKILDIDNDALRFLALSGSAGWSGLSNFGRGMQQLFNDEALPTSATQYADQYIVEELGKEGWDVPFTDRTLGQLAYEGTSTITNMAPSWLAAGLVSVASGGLGAPAAVTAALSGAAGSAALGLSAGGNAYNQAIKDGYTEDQARTFGTMVGASEGALQYLLGGVSKLAMPGGLSSKMISKVSGIENGLLRAVATGGVMYGAELTEEELQLYLEPLYRTLIFDEQYEAPEVEEIVYTAAITLLTTGTMNAGEIISTSKNNFAQNGNQISAAGSESVQALIESGLESDKKTESYKLAEKLQNKINNGQTPSEYEIGRLQQLNAEAIAEEQQSDPYTLEQLAQETVAEASQNAPVTLEELARETVAEREASQQAVPYNAMSMENPVRKARDNAIKNTGYGENGIKAFTEAVDRSGESVDQMRAKFQTAYELGRFDTPREKVELVTELQKIAYNAGRLDYIDDLGKKVNTATAGAKSGFDSAGAPSFVTSTQTRIVDDLAKALGSKVVIGKTKGNAHITGSGAVVIADDFQTKVGGNDVSIVYHAAHEIGMHRLMQLAPTEGRAFINAMYNYMSEGRPQTATTLVEEKQSAYAEQDVSLSTDKAAEEVVANSILSLYENEEAFGEAVRRIMNGNDQQAKRGLRKFREIMGDIVKKLKAIIAKLTGKEKSEAQQALSEVEQLREMYESALAAAVKKNRELEATKNTAQMDGDGGQFSLKTVNGKQVVWIENSALTNKQLQSHTAVAEYIAQHIGEVYTIIESGQKVYIGEDLPAEFTQSKYTDSIRKSRPEILRAKNKSINELGLLIETATNRRWEKTKHTHNKDAKYGMYRYDSSFAFPVKDRYGNVTKVHAYDAELLIRNASNGKKYLYDIVGIKENTTSAIDLQRRETRLAAHKAATRGDVSTDSVAQVEDVVNEDTQYSLVTDKKTLDFLDNQKLVKVYRAMQEIDGKLYPPMAAITKGQDGKSQLVSSTKKGAWYQSDERPDLIKLDKKGKPYFELKKGNGKMVPAAYNPYFHTSVTPLNDQFSSAYDRPNLVVVEGYIPESELTSGYKAQYAKDSVGETTWHAGPVASKLKGDKARRVFLSRWFKAERVVPVEEVARTVAKTLDGEGVSVPWNVVTPSLREALENEGVEIDYKDAKFGSKVVSFESTQYSLNDSEGTTLTTAQQEYFKNSKARDKDGNLQIFYHGTPNAGFTVFDTSRGRYGGSWFTTSRIDADSYAGNYEHKLFDPNEKASTRTVQSGDFRIGSEMRFDTEEDRANFIKENPAAENYRTDAEIEALMDKASEDGDWDAYDALEEELHSNNRKRIKKAYGRYEWEHAQVKSIGEMLDNPEGYTISDLIRAYDAYDSNNAAQDSVLEGATVEDLIDGLRNEAEENPDVRDVTFRARIQAGQSGDVIRTVNNRTYAVYLNAERPAEFDGHGRTIMQGNFYQKIEEAMKNDRYDSVIVRNLRTGAHQENGDVVIVKSEKQIKLITNKNPTDDPDVRYSLKEGATIEEMEARISELNSEYQKMEWKEREFKATVEYNRFMEDIDNRIGDEEYKKWLLEAFPKWMRESGYDELSKRMNLVREEIKTINRSLTRAKEQAAKEARLANRAKYNEEFNKKYASKAARKFGTTGRFDLAGYLTVNGSLLDFSDGQGYRVQDHREIAEVLDFLPEDHGYSDGLIEFMNMGNIRLQSYGIDISKAPNAAQRSKLRQFFQLRRGEIVVDFSDENGLTVGSNEYNEGTSANKILADIDAYFETGEVPNQSIVSQFHSQFSLKEQNDLLKENAKLKEVNEGLREQFKTTTFAKVDKKSLDKFTKTLLKDYQSGADINEIRDALNDVYTYMANGEDGQTAAWNDLQERAYNVAVSILENASTVNDEMYQTYKGLRDRLRSYPISINKEYDHDIQGYESINDFRKANFGRMKITSDGTPVDIVYADLANTYPEFFDESEYVTQADQIAHIADVLDSLQPYEVNPYSGDMRRAATWLASDILERFYELPQAKPTFADKQAAKLTKQVIKDAKKLENLREQKKERIRELIRRNREKVKEATQKERAKRAEAVKEIKDHYKAKEKKASESRKARELRAKIMRHAQEMSKKLLRPTDKQHIPQELRGAVVELLEAINLESKYTIDPETGKRLSSGEGDPTKRTAKFTALKKQLKAIKARGGDGMVFDPSLLGVEEDGIPSKFDQVSAMSETPLHAMNSEQLTTVWEVLKAVETAISNANKTLSKSKFATTVDWAMAFEEDTASRRVKRSSEQHYTLDIETPYTFFSHFGDAGHSLYRMLRNAQDHQQIMQDELVKKIGQIASLERRNKLEKEATTFTTDRGEKLVLSKAHVMEMYLLSKRPQAYNHLIHGGIVQPEVGKTRRGTSVTLLTEVDVAKITSSLTAEERAMADKYQALTNLLAEWGNKASMKAYGYEKFGDPNYWPIHSASEHVQHTTEKGATQRARSIANMGSAKPLTPEATNTLDLYGIFSTFDNHAADMMDYAAWLLPMEDVNRLYNFNFRNDEGRTVKTMRDLLNDYGGAKSDRYWANLMTDIQNGVNFPADTAFEGLVSKMVGNTKRAAVAANLRVVIQQPTAMARASVVLDPDLLMLNMGKGVTVKAMVDGWAKAKKYSPIAARKAAGGFEIASNPKQLSEVFYKPETKTGKFVTGVKESGMLLPGWADAATWGILWNTCESQVKRDINDLKPGTDEFYEAVNELFTEVIDQTQVVDGVLQRSQAMRSSSSLMKQMTSFTGEPTQAGNMIMRAYDKVRYETDGKKRGKAIAVLSRAVSAYMVTAAINAFAQSLVDALRDDDDEKDYWEKVWKAWSGISGKEETWFDFARNILLASNVVNNLNPLTWIPVAKDILSLVQGYAVQRMDVSAFGDLINSITMTIKTITGDGKQTTGYAALKTMLIAGKLFNGFGGYNALRDIEGIVRTFQVETDDYLALYETEKLMTKPKNNVKVYTDMLYHAYTDDKEQYDELYKMMLKDGFKADELEKAIDSRKERDALAGTGYKSSKAAYDALYSMKQEKRTAEYDALRNKLLNATYQTVGGRTEKLFTAAKIDSAMQARKVADGIDAMGFSTTDGVYDTMYDELRSGDMSDYYKYVVSMMGLDVEPSDIESAMRSRAKEDGLSVDDLTEALAAGGFKPKYPVASEDGFDIDDLSTVQYKTYSRAYGDMIDELMDNFARNGFDGLVAEDANEWLSSAYSYAKETALEIATNGKYQSDTEWINDAQAAEENGVSVADYIITKAGYGSSAAKKMQEAREYGIDADMYTNFLDTLDEYDQPTESGKYGTFTQEEAARAIAAIPGLTREQRAYLWQSVNKGWKAKNNPWR